MRRFVILILIIQGLITTYIVIRDFSGLPSMPWLTIASTAVAFIFAWLHAGLNLGWRRALLFIIITISVALTLESIGVAIQPGCSASLPLLLKKTWTGVIRGSMGLPAF